MIGLCGILGYETALSLFRLHEVELRSRFSHRFLEDFRKLKQQVIDHRLSDQPGCKVFEIGEGGLFGTLWRACEMLGSGCRVELLRVPVRQEIVEICELYGEDPYEVPSPGSFLVIREDGKEAPSVAEVVEDGQKELLSILEESVIIGKLTNDGRRVLVWDDMVRYLTPPQRQRKDIMDRKNEVHTC